MNHIEFENKVMNALLKGESEVLQILRRQYEAARIESREFTGVGFFTDFIIDDQKLKLNIDKFNFGDVYGGYNENDLKIGFILFIENGYISSLEGYVLEDIIWPENYNILNLYYESGLVRDIEALKKEWL